MGSSYVGELHPAASAPQEVLQQKNPAPCTLIRTNPEVRLALVCAPPMLATSGGLCVGQIP